MLPNRQRASVAAISAVLLLVTAGLSAPVAAADSPEAAVNELLDIVDSGDLDRIASVTCEAEKDNLRATFDISAQMGLGSDGPQPGALEIEITDRSLEVTSQEGDVATVQVRATFSISVEEAQVEAIVRGLLEAERAPDDPPVSDEDLQAMLPLMSSALNQSQPMDEEVALVREDGQWLVCGGFGQSEEPAADLEAQVSSEGLCGLATPSELGAVGDLDYENSDGFDTVCTYSNSTYDDYHAATISFNQGYDIESLKQIFTPQQELEVDGYPAFASDLQFFVQIGQDVLQISLYPGETPAPDYDVVADATALARLFIPRLPALAGPEPEPTPEPTPETSLCDLLPIEQLNELSGMTFDEAAGDSSGCSYSSLDPERGINFINSYTIESSLDEMRTYLPDVTEVTIGGQPAISSAEQLFIELPDGATLLNVAVYLDPSIEEPAMTAPALAALVGERFLASMP